MKIVSSRAITLSELKEILKERKGGMESEQEAVFSYLETFVKTKKTDDEEYLAKLKQFDFPEEILVKLVDLKPKNLEFVKTILRQEKITIEDEKASEIAKIFE